MFTDDNQDRIARRQYQDLMVGKEKVSPWQCLNQSISISSKGNDTSFQPQQAGPTCQRSLQRFVCASVFPECPNEGLGVPFVPVCRTLCREVSW